MRALAALTILTVLALVSSGCRPEDEQQRAARLAAESWAAQRPAYDGEAHCTDAAKQGYVMTVFTSEFLCAVELVDGDCDWVRVRFREGSPIARVDFYRRRGGCILAA